MVWVAGGRGSRSTETVELYVMISLIVHGMTVLLVDRSKHLQLFAVFFHFKDLIHNLDLSLKLQCLIYMNYTQTKYYFKKKNVM